MPPPRRARGARRNATLPPDTVRHELAIRGKQRQYLLTAPFALAETRVGVLNLHGATSGMEQQLHYSQVPQRAADRGWVTLTPQGLGRIPRWSIAPMPGADADIKFLAEILARATEQHSLTTWYATGISNGGAMVTRLTSEWPGLFRAIAPVAGINAAFQHPPSAPTSLIAFHGTDDRVVPYRGGRLFPRRSGPLRARVQERRGFVTELEDVETLVGRFASAAGATGAPTVTPIGPDVVRTVYTGATVRTELYTVRGGGHVWPGAIDVPLLGTTTHTIDATGLILEFFEAAPAL
jgi:polyhydroxybutyrate depolymerase